MPHDWSIEGPFDKENPTGKDGGFLPSGVGWYRKSFTLPASYRGKRVFVEFDGVMANSDVWVNGHHLGKRPFGYIGFRYELTPHLDFGAGRANVVAVRADNSGQPASRWYTGAGIYRHARLVVTDPVHVEHWGTFVTTPEVSAEHATVRVESTVVNQSETPRSVSLEVTLVGPDGRAGAGARNQTASHRPRPLRRLPAGDRPQEPAALGHQTARTSIKRSSRFARARAPSTTTASRSASASSASTRRPASGSTGATSN